jgi:NAD(P)-dependent dehydrogenase (short-subunit alcohol dehydrogenase family)
LAEYTGFKPDDIKIVGIECDVSSESSVQKAFSKIIEIFGRIDAVVASAGDYSGYLSVFFSLNIFMSTPGIVENYPALEYVHPDCF